MDQFSRHPLYRVHNIDSAMNSLWEFYKKNFLPLFLISVVVAFGLQYASSFIDLKEIQSVTDPLVMLEKMQVYLIPMMIISLFNLLFTTIIQHYIIFKPVDSSVTILNSILLSFRYFIPYLIIIILLSFTGAIAILLGLFALVVGAFFAAIYVFTLYLFILPVMMAEGIDTGLIIRRVFSLAHRNFWANFGWVSTFIVILIVISVILQGIILLPFTGGFLRSFSNPDDISAAAGLTTNPLFFILTALANALTFPLMPIFSTILYFNGQAREQQEKTVLQSDTETGKVRVEDLYAKPYSEDHPDNPENMKDIM